MLRGTHNGQATAEREGELKLGRYVLELKITKPTLKKEGDSAVDPGLISPKLLIKPGPREERRERRREDRMREEGLLGGSGHKTCARAKPISSLGHDVLRVARPLGLLDIQRENFIIQSCRIGWIWALREGNLLYLHSHLCFSA